MKDFLFFLAFVSLTLPSPSLRSHHGSKELELYKEELVFKPALLVVNKMDLPDAEDKLAELKEQLQNPHGKSEGFFFFFYYSLAFVIFKFGRNYDVNKIMYLNTISIFDTEVCI